MQNSLITKSSQQCLQKPNSEAPLLVTSVALATTPVSSDPFTWTIRARPSLSSSLLPTPSSTAGSDLS